MPAGDAAINLKAALGKQVDVRFSESFAKGRLASPDIDGVVIYELPPGKLCLYGQGKGLEPAAALAEFANPNGGGDICVPLADVSVRLPPQSRCPAPRRRRSIRPTARLAAGRGSRARGSACGPSSASSTRASGT